MLGCTLKHKSLSKKRKVWMRVFTRSQVILSWPSDKRLKYATNEHHHPCLLMPSRIQRVNKPRVWWVL